MSMYVAAAAGLVGAMLLGLARWPMSIHGFEFAGLMLATLLNSALEKPRHATKDGSTMPLSFVIDFTALLLLGPLAASFVAAAGVLAQRLDSPRYGHAVVDVATIVAATQAAGLMHVMFGGSTGLRAWPWQAVPVAAAAIGYSTVRNCSLGIVVPFLTGDRVTLSCALALRAVPNYILGASVAVAVVEGIEREMWGALAAAIVPLHIVYRTYRHSLDRMEREHANRGVIDALDQGMCATNDAGQVTLWNDALQRMLDCPRERAVGRSIVGAVPLLGKTEFPRALADALTHRCTQALTHLMLPSADGARILQIKIIPGVHGMTVLWHDHTARSRAEYALRKSEERFALMEAGVNDGLWEWDCRTREVYFSARWRALVGLPEGSSRGRPEDWFERVHPEDADLLKHAIEAHLAGQTERLQHEHRIRHEDGSYRHFACRGVAVRSTSGRAIRMAGSLTDVTDRANAHERLRSAGYRDALTGLSNRAVFVERLGQRLKGFKQGLGGRFAVLYLDLDRFKVVNDSLGHLVGDELLSAVSRRLESCLREGDALARLGGDEFAILLSRLDGEGQANGIAFRIQDALSTPFSIGGREVFTSASIGLAFSAPEYNHPDEIMRDADTAMYHAKARGKARHELFDADMHARALDRLGLENDLRHAIKSGDFEIHYQPIVSLTSGSCAGFEALVRWNRNGKVVAPDKFIPVAEELGLIEPLGTWVLREACRTFGEWQRRFPDHRLECITVNVSTHQLMQHNFLYIVEQAVEEARLKPSNLRLEITETTLMGSPYMAADALRALRDFGAKIYLDDFGTGYSSLSHLHKLPVDALKIDRSFVRSLLLPDRPAIVESILALARTLDTGVVAEGVESGVQARELKRLGCRHAQGFYFSPPLSSVSVEALLRSPWPLGRPRPASEPAKDSPIASKPFEWPDETATPTSARPTRAGSATILDAAPPQPQERIRAGSNRHVPGTSARRDFFVR